MVKKSDGKTVLVRIKRDRAGHFFDSCGVPVRPPEQLVRKPGIKKLCPKLVPGQVLRVPVDHNILNQDCIEVVRGELYEDEFERPWVFDNPADAVLANPSKSNRSVEEILAGLAFGEGAKESQKRKLEARMADAEDEDDEDDDYQGNPQNRMTRGEAEELRKAEEEREEDLARQKDGPGLEQPRRSRRQEEPQPSRRRGRG